MKLAEPKPKVATSSRRTRTPTTPAPNPPAPKSSLTSTTRNTAAAVTPAAISKDTSGISARTIRGRVRSRLFELLFAGRVVQELYSDTELAVLPELVHVRDSPRKAPVRYLSRHQLLGHV